MRIQNYDHLIALSKCLALWSLPPDQAHKATPHEQALMELYTSVKKELDRVPVLPQVPISFVTVRGLQSALQELINDEVRPTSDKQVLIVSRDYYTCRTLIDLLQRVFPVHKMNNTTCCMSGCMLHVVPESDLEAQVRGLGLHCIFFLEMD